MFDGVLKFGLSATLTNTQSGLFAAKERGDRGGYRILNGVGVLQDFKWGWGANASPQHEWNRAGI